MGSPMASSEPTREFHAAHAATALTFWTVRRKMFIPALVAVGATLLATVAMSAIGLSARQRLTAVEEKHFPVLRFDQTMLNSLKELHLLLKNVGESETMNSIDIPDELHDYILQKIQTDGPTVLGDAAAAEQLRVEFEQYYVAARALATKLVQAQLKAKRAVASAKNALVIHNDT